MHVHVTALQDDILEEKENDDLSFEDQQTADQLPLTNNNSNSIDKKLEANCKTK